MFVFPRRLIVGDVSVIHPTSGSCAQTAARLPGWAAARRDAAKERAYRRVSSGLPFVPLSVESFGRLGAPALLLLRSLADHAVQAWGPGLSRDAFISGALREPCATVMRLWVGPACTTLLGCLAWPRCAASLVPRPRWSEVVRGCLFASRIS
jgi:hypothetical protein